MVKVNCLVSFSVSVLDTAEIITSCKFHLRTRKDVIDLYRSLLDKGYKYDFTFRYFCLRSNGFAFIVSANEIPTIL